MILATGAMILTGISAAVFIRLRECHVSVNQVLQEMNAAHAGSLSSVEVAQSWQPSDVAFTESLLALGRVGLRVPGGSRVPEPVESSSLALVRPDQSKIRVPAL